MNPRSSPQANKLRLLRPPIFMKNSLVFLQANTRRVFTSTLVSLPRLGKSALKTRILPWSTHLAATSPWPRLQTLSTYGVDLISDETPDSLIRFRSDYHPSTTPEKGVRIQSYNYLNSTMCGLGELWALTLSDEILHPSRPSMVPTMIQPAPLSPTQAML